MIYSIWEKIGWSATIGSGIDWIKFVDKGESDVVISDNGKSISGVTKADCVDFFDSALIYVSPIVNSDDDDVIRYGRWTDSTNDSTAIIFKQNGNDEVKYVNVTQTGIECTEVSTDEKDKIVDVIKEVYINYDDEKRVQTINSLPYSGVTLQLEGLVDASAKAPIFYCNTRVNVLDENERPAYQECTIKESSITNDESSVWSFKSGNIEGDVIKNKPEGGFVTLAPVTEEREVVVLLNFQNLYNYTVTLVQDINTNKKFYYLITDIENAKVSFYSGNKILGVVYAKNSYENSNSYNLKLSDNILVFDHEGNEKTITVESEKNGKMYYAEFEIPEVEKNITVKTEGKKTIVDKFIKIYPEIWNISKYNTINYDLELLAETHNRTINDTHLYTTDDDFKYEVNSKETTTVSEIVGYNKTLPNGIYIDETAHTLKIDKNKYVSGDVEFYIPNTDIKTKITIKK